MMNAHFVYFFGFQAAFLIRQPEKNMAHYKIKIKKKQPEKYEYS
ncbi:hypothetical protein [Wielerella bovis]|nr:hypothetical protein [Wielerella bovis]